MFRHKFLWNGTPIEPLVKASDWIIEIFSLWLFNGKHQDIKVVHHREQLLYYSSLYCVFIPNDYLLTLVCNRETTETQRSISNKPTQ